MGRLSCILILFICQNSVTKVNGLLTLELSLSGKPHFELSLLDVFKRLRLGIQIICILLRTIGEVSFSLVCFRGALIPTNGQKVWIVFN